MRWVVASKVAYGGDSQGLLDLFLEGGFIGTSRESGSDEATVPLEILFALLRKNGYVIRHELFDSACEECGDAATVADCPPRGVSCTDDFWCDKHTPEKPRDGWDRVKLTPHIIK